MRLKSKVGERGQVVVPKKIRNEMGIRPGMQVYFQMDDEGVRMETGDDKALEEFFTAIPKIKPPKDIDWNEMFYSQLEK